MKTSSAILALLMALLPLAWATFAEIELNVGSLNPGTNPSTGTLSKTDARFTGARGVAPLWGPTPAAYLVCDFDAKNIRSINPANGDTSTVAYQSNNGWPANQAPQYIVTGSDEADDLAFFTTDAGYVQKVTISSGAVQQLADFSYELSASGGAGAGMGGIAKWFNPTAGAWKLLTAVADFIFQQGEDEAYASWQISTAHGFAVDFNNLGGMSTAPDGFHMAAADPDQDKVWVFDLNDIQKSNGSNTVVYENVPGAQDATWTEDGTHLIVQTSSGVQFVSTDKSACPWVASVNSEEYGKFVCPGNPIPLTNPDIVPAGKGIASLGGGRALASWQTGVSVLMFSAADPFDEVVDAFDGLTPEEQDAFLDAIDASWRTDGTTSAMKQYCHHN